MVTLLERKPDLQVKQNINYFSVSPRSYIPKGESPLSISHSEQRDKLFSFPPACLQGIPEAICAAESQGCSPALQGRAKGSTARKHLTSGAVCVNAASDLTESLF